MSPIHHRDDDRDEVVENEIEEVYGRRKFDTAWGLSPQSITALLGILGMLAATFWTLSDYRVTLANMDSRMTVISGRVLENEKRLNDIDINLSLIHI